MQCVLFIAIQIIQDYAWSNDSRESYKNLEIVICKGGTYRTQAFIALRERLIADTEWALISLEIGTGQHHVQKGKVTGAAKWTKISTDRSRRCWWVMRSLCLELSSRYRHFIQYNSALHELIIEHQAAASVTDEDQSCNIIAPTESCR